MKKYLFISSLSLILWLVVSPLRGGYITVCGLTGLTLALLVGCILFFLLTFLLLNKYKNRLSLNGVFLSVVSGILIWELPLRSFIFTSALFSLPGSLFYLLSVVVAYWVFRTKRIIFKVGITVLFLALCLWFSYYGYIFWNHKLNYGSFTGKIELVETSPLVFQNDNNENVYLNNNDCNYLLLDFWTSSCGVCFQAFPEVQRVYEEWKNIDQVQIYSIFCRNEKREEVPASGTEMLRKRGCTFPSLSMNSKDPFLKKVGVNGFPTVLIFDKDKETIVFRGDILQAEKFLEKKIPR